MLAVFIVFGTLAAIVLGSIYLFLSHKERMQRLESGDPAGKSLKMLEYQRHELEQRLSYLEEIVCSVDYELNAKLTALASQKRRLPESAPSSTLADGGGPLDEQSDAYADTDRASQAFFRGDLVAGRTIDGRFIIDRRLGEGGLGTVYLAHDQKLDEPVALKVLRELTLEQDPNARERFRREVLAARRISHPNVVRLHDLYEADGIDFVAMEYVDGQSLRGVIDHPEPVPIQRVVDLAVTALDALQACHDAGTIHRDIKPDNLLIDRNNTLKLIDFGIAKFGPNDQKRLTASQMIMGTPAYMSPEQLRGNPVDLRCDLYAFGSLLFELVTGRPPFEAATPIQMAYAHCSRQPQPPSSLRDDLADGWDEVVLKALQKKPADRYASAEAMGRAVQALSS